MIVAFVLLACGGGSAPEWPVERYGQACLEQVGAVPDFVCTDGVEAAVTVEGQTPTKYEPNMACDRPALLPYDDGDGQCVPGSRALVLADTEDLQIAAFCRMKRIRPAGSTTYDEIDVIAHDPKSGATCWFQATSPSGLDGTAVPSPTGPRAKGFWNLPEKTAAQNCGGCHDSDPFYYSPFVAQTGQLPADPFGPYHNAIGPMQSWPEPSTLDTPANACTGCHRIGNQHTCHTGMYASVGKDPDPAPLDAWARTYPASHWMPLLNDKPQWEWEAAYQASVEALAACCEDPGAAGCIATPLSAWR